jgi:hypothetical protein
VVVVIFVELVMAAEVILLQLTSIAANNIVHETSIAFFIPITSKLTLIIYFSISRWYYPASGSFLPARDNPAHISRL